MHAVALRRGEIVDAPPADLEAHEGEQEDPAGGTPLTGLGFAEMEVNQITKPGDGCPCFFRIPGPIMAPGLLRPQGAEQHTDGQERQSHIYQIVRNVHRVLGRFPVKPGMTMDKQQVDRHQCRRSQHRVGEHIDNHVRGEPGALEGRHKGLRMNARLEQVHADEHQSQHGAERQDPLVTPTTVDDDAGKREEEGIPEPCLPHRPERRALQGNPQPHDESEEYGKTGQRECIDKTRTVFPGEEGPDRPAQDGPQGEPDD